MSSCFFSLVYAQKSPQKSTNLGGTPFFSIFVLEKCCKTADTNVREPQLYQKMLMMHLYPQKKFHDGADIRHIVIGFFRFLGFVDCRFGTFPLFVPLVCHTYLLMLSHKKILGPLINYKIIQNTENAIPMT